MLTLVVYVVTTYI